ncbi:hypothetical protein FRC07_013425 [Ceratobasidium sp. 392]|nr:hypothetical protein FRC07_013425 [Ceratobasidium sp. 392]
MVAFTFTALTAAIALFTQSALAAPSPSVDANGLFMSKRAASCTFPSPPKTSSLSAAKTITGTFDGGNVRFDRGKGACTGQKEGGDKDAVFILESGATIKNVVIGANQAEGIHCLGPCTIQNVWFEDVCEDAITIKQKSGTSTIIGGGAKGASDKVVQHNGGGTFSPLPGMSSLTRTAFKTLASSTALAATAARKSHLVSVNSNPTNSIKSSQYKRTVTISNVIAKNGKLLAGVNSNYGDIATIKTKTNSYTSVKSVCDTFQGNNKGDEPPKLTSNKKNTK